MSRIPGRKPDPDFNRLRKVLFRDGEPDRIPFLELFADVEIIEAILGEKLVLPGQNARQVRKRAAQKLIEFHYRLGYDYVVASAIVPFQYNRISSEDTARDLPRERREWVNEASGIITNRKEFENYNWPTSEVVDYSALEETSRNLPDGMKIIGTCPSILEPVMWLMGYQPFALSLTDDPQLVSDMFDKVGDLVVNIYKNLVEIENMGALWLSDDMGHRSGTMISPKHLRQYVLPWHKKIVEVVHQHDLPILLHSCGNLEEIMDDLIDYVGIDAKHSFEDAIMPVWEAKRRYGKRISILGGVDVDILSRRTEDEVRGYVRRVIAECGPGGGYCLGSGNSVANYIKVENYLAMLDEGWKLGTYPIH